jgi:hypothetical protein
MESPEYVAVIVCDPAVVDEKVYVAEPLASVSVGDCVVPSTAIVTDPVGVGVLDADPEATVIVMRSFAPTAGVVVAADTVVCEATAVTVRVSEPFEAAYVVSPE